MVGQVIVEVDEDRTGNMAFVVGRAPGARPAEIPPHVDDANVGILDALREIGERYDALRLAHSPR